MRRLTIVLCIVALWWPLCSPLDAQVSGSVNVTIRIIPFSIPLTNVLDVTKPAQYPIRAIIGEDAPTTTILQFIQSVEKQGIVIIQNHNGETDIYEAGPSGYISVQKKPDGTVTICSL